MERATKIFAGEYRYRGWAISRQYSEGYNEWCWYIAATCWTQGQSYFDLTSTKRQAMKCIDEAIANGNADEV